MIKQKKNPKYTDFFFFLIALTITDKRAKILMISDFLVLPIQTPMVSYLGCNVHILMNTLTYTTSHDH